MMNMNEDLFQYRFERQSTRYTKNWKNNLENLFISYEQLW
jgi:hypothetical protein